MSYSFSISADSKADARAKVRAELDKVVASQPVHAADKAAAEYAAEAFIGLLVAPVEGERICVSMHGSLSWRSEGVYIGANVGVSASVQSKS